MSTVDWLDNSELTDEDRAALDAALADYAKAPDAGSSWDEVQARIEGKLRPWIEGRLRPCSAE